MKKFHKILIKNFEILFKKLEKKIQHLKPKSYFEKIVQIINFFENLVLKNTGFSKKLKFSEHIKSKFLPLKKYDLTLMQPMK